MEFKDEFETEVNNKTYFVEVEGEMEKEGDVSFTNVLVKDDLGQLVNVDDQDYELIMDEVRAREYELELHEADFEFYNTNLGN